MTVLEGAWLSSDETQQALSVLTDSGFQALVVGGCVRNALLDVPISDVDIATDALPQEVERLAQAKGFRTIPTGIAHGTVTLLIGSSSFEITTFRQDIDTDGRHATVAFSTDIKTDAERRDFTMNALYAQADGTLVDPLNGLPDLLARRVVFVGAAQDRIREDYLRILRFFRFHAWYGDPTGGIDADGLAAIAENADGLEGLSKERVGAEMTKLLSAVDPAPALATMAQCGVLMRILPGATAASLPILVHFEDLHDVPPNAMRRLALLGGENLQETLRLSKSDARRVETLRDTSSNGQTIGAIGYLHGKDVARDTVLIRAALFEMAPRAEDFQAAEKGAQAVFPIKAADLPGEFVGRAIGDKLKDLEARWIASDFELSKPELLS